MKQVIIRKSVLTEMARPKVERTIDPKIWATMASLCSRTYKSDKGENAKPIGATKDALLARYVAGLIIMKQPCPTNINDIDDIAALKQYGHKLVDELNVPFEDIQKLYNENCGNLPKAEIKDNTQDKSTGGFFNQANVDKLKNQKKPSVASIATREIKKYITFTPGKKHITEQKNIIVILKGSDNNTYFVIIYKNARNNDIYIATYVVDKKVHMVKDKDIENNIYGTIAKDLKSGLLIPDNSDPIFIANDFYELYYIVPKDFKEIVNFIEDNIDSVDTTQNTNITIGTPLYANIFRKKDGYGQSTECYSIDDITGKDEEEIKDHSDYTYKSIKIGQCIDTDGPYYRFLLDIDNVVTSVEITQSLSRGNNYYTKGVVSLYNGQKIKNYLQKYKINYYTTAAEAKQDFDGIGNCVCLSNNFDTYAFSYGGEWFRLSNGLKAAWAYYDFKAISLKGGQYLPSLGELIKLYKKIPAIQYLDGFIWSSTPASMTKFWAYDGHRIKALDIINDKAHITPLIAIKKNNISYIQINNYLRLDPIQIYRGDPTNFQKKPVIKSTLEDIKKKYNSILLIEPVLKKYLKEKVPLASTDRYEFRYHNMFDDRWNYTINSIELYKGDLMFGYWVGGDSTDEDGYIHFYELPRYAGQTKKIYAERARATMTLKYDDMLQTAQKFLFEIIKKYGE